MGIIAGIAIPTTIAVINRQKKNAAVKSAENIFTAAKELLLEAQSSGVVDGVTEATGTNPGYTYQTSASAMVTSGDLEKNPIDGTGDMTVQITSTNKFKITETSVTINKVPIYIINNADGTFKEFSTTQNS